MPRFQVFTSFAPGWSSFAASLTLVVWFRRPAERSSEHAEATAPDNPSKAVPKFSPGFFQVHPALHLAIHQGLHPAKHPMLHPSAKHPVVFPSPES